jgi:hypothetical protein
MLKYLPLIESLAEFAFCTFIGVSLTLVYFAGVQ